MVIDVHEMVIDVHENIDRIKSFDFIEFIAFTGNRTIAQVIFYDRSIQRIYGRVKHIQPDEKVLKYDDPIRVNAEIVIRVFPYRLELEKLFLREAGL